MDAFFPVPSPPSAGERVRVRGRALNSAPLTLSLSPHRNVGRGDREPSPVAINQFAATREIGVNRLAGVPQL